MRHHFVLGGLLLAASSLPNRASSQSIAPDNTQVAIPWGSQMQTVNGQTGNLIAVPQGDLGTRASWSPNGRYLVFMTGRTDTSMRLLDMRTNVTRILGANLVFPVAWREDSNRLAMFYQPPTGKTELIQYGVSDKGIALRTTIDVMPTFTAPMLWLPATDNVAFVAKDGNVYTVEENEIKKITTSNDVIGMALSGDKKSLLWARRGPNPKYILVTFYVYDLTSRSVKRLDFPGQIPGINPNPRQAPVSIQGAGIAPDGSRAALVVTLEQPGMKGAPPTRSTAVYIVRLDGTGARLVTTAPAASRLEPFWSPDSRTVAVLRTGAPENALILADADGGGPRAVLGPLK